jgi:hypothetical protein
MSSATSRKLTATLLSALLIATAALGVTFAASALASPLHGLLRMSWLTVAGAVAMGLAIASVLVVERLAWVRRMPWAWGGVVLVVLAVAALAFWPPACAHHTWVLSATVLGTVFGLALASTRVSATGQCVAALLLVALTLAVGPQPMCGKVRAALVGAI